MPYHWKTEGRQRIVNSTQRVGNRRVVKSDTRIDTAEHCRYDRADRPRVCTCRHTTEKSLSEQGQTLYWCRLVESNAVSLENGRETATRQQHAARRQSTNRQESHSRASSLTEPSAAELARVEMQPTAYQERKSKSYRSCSLLSIVTAEQCLYCRADRH